MINVGFFSSSKDCLKTKYSEEIMKLLLEIKKLDKIKNVVYGGGTIGIMGLVREVFNDKIISHNLEKWKEFDNETIHPDIISRQRALIDNSDLFIVLPGGVGTVSELFDCIMMNDTKSFQKPIMIFNCDDYFTDLYNYIEKLYANGASKKNSSLLYIEKDIGLFIHRLHHYLNEICETVASSS
jgi:uncharacterized protein (TIGR00730 family)